jgi:hypothetical protein
MGADPPPAFFELCQDFQRHLRGRRVQQKLVDKLVQQPAKRDADAVVDEKVVHEIVQDPVADSDEGADPYYLANLIGPAQGPSESRKEHAEEVGGLEEGPVRKEEVGQ